MSNVAEREIKAVKFPVSPAVLCLSPPSSSLPLSVSHQLSVLSLFNLVLYVAESQQEGSSL